MAKISVGIPEGKVGLTFTGKAEPILSRVTYGGPCHGKPIKPGYLVKGLTLGNGITHEGLSKVELVKKLGETTNDHNRKLIFEIAHKKGTHEVELPAGNNIGATIEDKNGKPVVTGISHTSPLRHLVSRGSVVDSISTDKFSLTGHNAEDINNVLKSSTNDATRVMTFKHPNEALSPKAIDYEEVIIDLPSGHGLGMQFTGNIATIQSVEKSSALSGLLFPGMTIAAIRIEDGREYHGLPGSIMYKILQETMFIEGRQLYCPAPGTEVASDVSLKFYPPMIALSCKELGCEFEETGDALKLVESFGSAFDVVPKGVLLLEFSFKSAVTGEWKAFTPTTVQELDSMLIDSSGCERFCTFLGVGSAYMPDECVVMCPPGKLGVVFKGNVAALVKIKEGSPFAQTNAMPGMVVQSVTIDGKITTNPSTKELTKLLIDNSEASRAVKLVNPETN